MAVPVPRYGILCYDQKTLEVKQVTWRILVRIFDDQKIGLNQNLIWFLHHMLLNVTKLQAIVS
jgi:hypothetical protein